MIGDVAFANNTVSARNNVPVPFKVGAALYLRMLPCDTAVLLSCNASVTAVDVPPVFKAVRM